MRLPISDYYYLTFHLAPFGSYRRLLFKVLDEKLPLCVIEPLFGEEVRDNVRCLLESA